MSSWDGNRAVRFRCERVGEERDCAERERGREREREKYRASRNERERERRGEKEGRVQFFSEHSFCLH